VFGFILAPRLQVYFQKNQILCTVMVMEMAFSMVTVAARLSGFFPANDSAFFIPLLAILIAMQAFMQAIGMIALLSMMADLVDEQALQTGKRQEGVFASGLALATKAVGSVGVIVGGLLVDHFIGLEPGQAGSAAAEISEDVIFRLAITDAVIVNVFVLIPVFLISRYSLTSERVAAIQENLDELRKKDSG
jgi:Na+/melibiose symporter-like transporter